MIHVAHYTSVLAASSPMPLYVFTAKFKTHFNNSLHTLLSRTLPLALCYTAKYKRTFLKYLAFPFSLKTT